tara:strand:+ start:359 stop:649 length:291 start_codon:yes stop_codon:yes gene_type:complete
MAVDTQIRSGTRVAYVRIFTSADGLKWTLLTNKPGIAHNNDITSLRWDPIRKQYISIASQVIAGPLECNAGQDCCGDVKSQPRVRRIPSQRPGLEP